MSSTSRTVTTQAELDKALKDQAATIHIDSPAGVWLTLTGTGSSSVEARGSSRVEAWGSSSVVARDGSSVVARDSSRVEAWGSSRVVARGSSRVVARDGSRVVARDGSRVEARDGSSVEAWGSSSVEAWGSSSVEARDGSSVEAGAYTAVHLHSARATVKGGHLIDLTKIDLTDPAQWLAYHGANVTKAGYVTLYKAVLDDWSTGRGAEWTYKPGSTVTAADFAPTRACGQGLHFGVSPLRAAAYLDGATRYVAVKVKASEVVPLGDKCKARSCKVLHEVDCFGERVPS